MEKNSLPLAKVQMRNSDQDDSSIYKCIDSLLESKARILVAVDGNSGAGKSTLSASLATVYDCNIFHMDDFFLPPMLKTKARLNEVGGNVDYLRFRDEVITGLQSGFPFQYRVYDCHQQAFTQTVTITPKPLNIIEGVYSMHPALIAYYDLKIFLQVGAEEQSKRILKRNGPDLHRRFLDEWIPLENRYFTELKIAEKCDLVLSR